MEPETLIKMPSTIKPLFNSNEPPSEAEIEEIEKTICAAERDIPSARDEVTLQTFRQYIRTLQSLLSLIRRMPPEIWALIFEHSLSDIYAINCPDTSQIITISHVCQKWRSISLSTPRLWGNLPSLSFKGFKPKLEYISYVREILERGNGTPISFYATDMLTIAYGVPNEPHPVFCLLASQFHRWRNVIISIIGLPGILKTLSDVLDAIPVRGRFPLLHTLELHFYSMDPFGLVLNVFKDAPSLRVVKLTHLWPTRIELPWHQLEEFTENGRSAENLLDVLRYSVDLRSLYCISHRLKKKYFKRFRPVMFNKLTSLKLDCGGFENSYGPLLEHITLPALTDLRIFDGGDVIIDEVTSLIRRSDCKLLHLTYFGDKSFPISIKLTPLLLLTPSLAELEVNEVSDLPSEGLERILQPDIIPRLRSLIIHIKYLCQKQSLIVDPQRFNATAHLRCSQNQISGHGSDCARLDVLSLRFEFPEHCLWFQQALQMWEYNPLCWRVLQDCIKELHEIEEELDEEVFCFGWDLECQTSRMNTRLQKILCDLEELPNIDPRIILSSGIVFYLWRMKTHSSIDDNIQRHIIESERKLRHKWAAHADTYSLSLSWVREGFKSLTYIPDATETVGCGEKFLYGV